MLLSSGIREEGSDLRMPTGGCSIDGSAVLGVRVDTRVLEQ